MKAEEARKISESTREERVEIQYNSIITQIKMAAESKEGKRSVTLYALYEENNKRFVDDGYAVRKISDPREPETFVITW